MSIVIRGWMFSTTRAAHFRMLLTYSTCKHSRPAKRISAQGISTNVSPAKVPVDHATMPRATLRVTYQKSAPEARTLDDED